MIWMLHSKDYNQHNDKDKKMERFIGSAVGEWNTSKKVYPNSQYSNIGGNMFMGNFNDKVCGNFIVSPQMCDITISEWSSRASANKTLKNYGLSQSEINKAWTDFKDQVQEQFDRTKFVKFAKEKVQTQVEAEPIDEEDTDYKDEINNEGSNNQVSANPIIDLRDKNKDIKQYLIYGGVGLAVIVGAVLIFRKK